MQVESGVIQLLAPLCAVVCMYFIVSSHVQVNRHYRIYGIHTGVSRIMTNTYGHMYIYCDFSHTTPQSVSFCVRFVTRSTHLRVDVQYPMHYTHSSPQQNFGLAPLK